MCCCVMVCVVCGLGWFGSVWFGVGVLCLVLVLELDCKKYIMNCVVVFVCDCL